MHDWPIPLYALLVPIFTNLSPERTFGRVWGLYGVISDEMEKQKSEHVNFHR